jgi:hypothetical protein
MTRWYHPTALAWTAYQVVSSANVTGMFDRRELMAALDPFSKADFDAHNDLSKPDDIWLDYVADTGDGWWPTHAIARLLASETLEVEGNTLPRGEALVFGGDQVYPTPSDEAYRTRLSEPFEAANRNAASPGSEQRRTGRLPNATVWATPGNHDWYDGLTSFSRWFCGRRPARGQLHGSRGHYVCGRYAEQTRSYFALKLPGNWWLCAADVQLNNWIDDEQIAYFAHIAAHLMEPDSNILLCVPNPQWEFVVDGKPGQAFESLTYLFAVVTGTGGHNVPPDGRRHRLRAVISGDAHHYARYVEQGTQAKWPIHYITCGLGGAFLHPTHSTKPQVGFEFRWPAPNVAKDAKPDAKNGTKWNRVFDRKAVYPPIETSRRLSLGNLLFGFLNWEFALATGLAWAFAGWLMLFGGTSIGEKLLQPDAAARCKAIWWILVSTPWPLLLAAGALAGTIYFSVAKGYKRWLVGGVHGAVHIGLWAAAVAILPAFVESGWAFVLAMLVVGAILPPLVFGLYLAISLFFFNAHWNEAFSSLRIADYKGFLRIRISRNGDAVIYPVGLDKVPQDETTALSPRMIEPPIRLAADPQGGTP